MAYNFSNEVTEQIMFFSRLALALEDLAKMENTNGTITNAPVSGKIIWSTAQGQFERHNGSSFQWISPKVSAESVIGVFVTDQLPNIPATKITGIINPANLGTGGDSSSFLRKDGTWFSIDPDSEIQQAIDAKNEAQTARNEAVAAANQVELFQLATNSEIELLNQKLYTLHTATAWEIHKLNGGF